MIDYDPHHWSSHLFDIRGSMVREIFGRLMLLTAWSALVIWAAKYVQAEYGFGLYLNPSMHQIVGIALGLLLVFRTNSSYDRFWEGRRLWGAIINETRNLGRGASIHFASAPQLKNDVLQWTIAFAYAAMYSLRKKVRARNGVYLPPAGKTAAEARLGPAGKNLDEPTEREMLAADHLPTTVAIHVGRLLRAGRDQGLISDIVFTSLDQNLQLLIDYIGGCERIHLTPIPYAYMVHARRVLLLFCATLPFALAQDFGYKTIPLTFLIGFVFLGIEEIGVEIEDPFGEDENDLPLERFCATIERNLSALQTAAAEESA